RSSDAQIDTSMPSKVTFPAKGRMLPSNKRANVDLPVPEGPITPTDTPGGIDNVIEDSTGSVAPG
ncbi:hypothetical protein OFN55_34695, partial [Escherichia coli]|nr:hypothetical protein [Escherichia coli]